MPDERADAGRGRLPMIWANLFFWTVAPPFSILFVLGAAVYVSIFGLVVWNRRRTKRLIRRCISRYGGIIIRLPWPVVKVRYVDHSPGDQPPFVFVCNHRSASDAFLMAVLPYECIQVLNIWPSRIPVLGSIGKLAGYLRVREMPFDDFLAAGSKLLGEGCSIIAFPEGTRSGSRRINQFRGSAFRLAQHNRVSIVPLAISGNENIPPRGSCWLRPGTITVAKLPAVKFEAYEAMTPFQLKTLARDNIARHLEAANA